MDTHMNILVDSKHDAVFRDGTYTFAVVLDGKLATAATHLAAAEERAALHLWTFADSTAVVCDVVESDFGYMLRPVFGPYRAGRAQRSLMLAREQFLRGHD